MTEQRRLYPIGQQDFPSLRKTNRLYIDKTDLYLIETKLNDSVEAAMHQIDLKDYASRFSNCGLPVTKVALNFDQETRTIRDWTIKEA